MGFVGLKIVYKSSHGRTLHRVGPDPLKALIIFVTGTLRRPCVPDQSVLCGVYETSSQSMMDWI